MRKAKHIGRNDAHCTDKKWGRILNIWVWKLNTAYFRDEANPALKPCPLQERVPGPIMKDSHIKVYGRSPGDRGEMDL